MASVEESATSTVAAGANPDSVVVNPRVYSVAPIRERDPNSGPPFDTAGLDVFIHGDPIADGDPVTSLALPDDSHRNGLNRSSASDGSPTLWAEPSPHNWDSIGALNGPIGVFSAPAAAADNTVAVLSGATHSISWAASEDFSVIVRPVATILGTRFESAQATLRANIETDLAGTVTQFVRDLFYGYGGGTSIVWPAVTVAPGQDFSFTVDLELVYRTEVTAPFNVESAGAQVHFQLVEHTSTTSPT